VLPMLIVWTLDDGQPVQLPEIRMGSDRATELDAFEVIDGVIRAHTREPDPGAFRADEYLIEVATDWTFDESGWNSQEISTVDTRPPPEPPSAALTGCETRTRRGRARRCVWVAAVNAGDYELASTVATPEVVEFGCEARATWGPNEWEFNGCSETCWFCSPSGDPQYHGTGIEMGIGTRDGGTIIEWIEG
jgi:hypothetical protein